MIILVYTLLLLTAGLVMRLVQLAEGTYNLAPAMVAEDLISLVLLWGSVAAIWGYARHRAIGSRRVWRGFVILLLVTMPITPFISPKYQVAMAEFGATPVWTSYFVSTLISLPLLWALYAYAFRRNSMWRAAG